MKTRSERQELRNFGLLVGGIVLAIGVWPYLYAGEDILRWALAIAAALILLGLALPIALRPVYAIWMKVGHVLGFINTRILLGVIFYGLLTPMGLVRRVLGKDTLQRSFAADAETYRVMKSPRDPSHVKHQF